MRISRYMAVCRLFGVGCFSGVLVLLSGCASYYSHYGSFEALNSQGEKRLIVVSWSSSESPIFGKAASPIELTTQCSTRKLVFRDTTSEENPCPSDGITACGDPTLDLDFSGRPVTSASHVCASITDKYHANRIADLSRMIEITISCWPASTEYEVDGEKKNRDYLKASVAPYTLYTKKVPLHSLEEKPPVPSEKVCKKKK